MEIYPYSDFLKPVPGNLRVKGLIFTQMNYRMQLYS